MPGSCGRTTSLGCKTAAGCSTSPEGSCGRTHARLLACSQGPTGDDQPDGYDHLRVVLDGPLDEADVEHLAYRTGVQLCEAIVRLARESGHDARVFE